MSVYWTINGVAACRSPLCYLVPGSTCSHANRYEPKLRDAILAFRGIWGDGDSIVIHDGPCQQQEPMCHCDEQCDCVWDLAPNLELELAAQRVRLEAKLELT